MEIFEPGRHVARVERKIQRVMPASGLPNGLSLWVKPFGSPDWRKLKKCPLKMRSVYNWDSIMDNLYIQYCVHRLNHMTIDNSTDESSPYTKMTGRGRREV